MSYAVLKDVKGKSGSNSLTAWAGVPFNVFTTSHEALDECIRVNKISKENGLSADAYIAEGELTDKGFIVKD